MTDKNHNDRQARLVLIAPEGIDGEAFASRLKAALSGGDVASVILPQYGLDEVAFQRMAEAATPVAQAAGAAVIVAGDSRIAGRVGADGMHVEGMTALSEAIEKHQARIAIGTGGVKTRDDALNVGELRPDYMFFGRFGYDNKPEAHPRNLALATWWADMIEIPCIVMAGSAIGSVEEAARTGAEFVALSRAVFDAEKPDEVIREANAILAAQALPTETGA